MGLAATLFAGDWLDWRGPLRDGTSPEKNLPATWTPAGQNLAWKSPVGGRSGPVVHGDHLYLLTTLGKGKTLQELLVCLNADTGKLLWQQPINLYSSDVPPHRAAWSSPAVDPVSGNVYVLSVHGTLAAFSRLGKLVWERPLAEEFGFVTTHGGRTVSPALDGDLVIISGVSTGWGQYSRAGHRFFAFDRKNGDLVYISAPGGRPYDTTYSPTNIVDVKGVRLLIAGGGDGNAHAIQPQTGVPAWRYEVSKRGINTGVVVNGTTAYISHSEENLDTSEMGLFSAIDATMKGPIKKDQAKFYFPGLQLGFSSPIIDGDRLIQIDNSANIFAFDVVTGRQIWKHQLGTIQRASPVLADGKLYVGTENGKFFILKPHNDRMETLSTKGTYAIGKKQPGASVPLPGPRNAPAGAAVAFVQIVPAEVTLKPGETANFRVRTFDASGNFIREEKAAWALEGLKGIVSDAGKYVAAADPVAQAGLLKATVGGVTGTARARVIPALNWAWDFEKIDAGKVPMEWVNCNTKFEVRQEEGNRALIKFADNPATKRARVFFGPIDMANYTVEGDVRSTQKRRQMGDVG
ncbi:MAG: hypothetical protein B7Z55_11445, partial [Planctomycetales bacterium 12-60-4]